MNHRLFVAVVVACLLTGSGAEARFPVDAGDPAPKKVVRVLLFSHAPTREYHFVRTLFVRECEQGRAELSIHLQMTRPGTVQDVPPERLLKDFPDQLQAEKGFDHLACYDLVIALDPDWTRLSREQADLLRLWVAQGGGLIVVVGPMHTFQLTRAVNQGTLKPIVDLFPVLLDDNRSPRAERSTESPFRLNFRTTSPEMTFLTLAEDRKELLAGWEEFFTGAEREDQGKEESVRFGFHDVYPVKKAKRNSRVIATFADPRSRSADGSECPYLVTMPFGQGRVFYIGSGEMWRLRQHGDAYHERFWIGLARYMRAGTDSLVSRSVLLVGEEYQAGEVVEVEVQLFKRNGAPVPLVASPRGRLVPPKGVSLPTRTFALLPVDDGKRWSGVFRGRVWLPEPGEYRIEVPIPETDDVLAGVITVKPPNTSSKSEDTLVVQELLWRRFRDAQRSLLDLAQRLESSKDNSARECAADLRVGLTFATREDLAGQLDRLVGCYKQQDRASLQDLQEAIERSELLARKVAMMRLLLVKSDIKGEAQRIADALAGLQSDGLARWLEEYRHQLDASRRQLEVLGNDLQKAEGLQSISARVKEIEDDLVVGWRHIRAALATSKALLKDLKVGPAWLGRMVEEKQCKPLAGLADPDFYEAIQSLAGFRKTLETGKGQRRSIDRGLEQLGRLITRLDRLTADLSQLSSLGTILAELNAIETQQRQQVEHLTGAKRRLLIDLLENASQSRQKR